MVTDPIADFLTRIRNAQMARHRIVEIPASNVKKRIAEILYEKGNQGLKYLPFRVAIAVGSASFIYRAIGKNILKNLPDTLKHRVIVGKFEKTKCVLQGFYCAVISRFQLLEPK
jgi:ribosomal protein S8